MDHVDDPIVADEDECAIGTDVCVCNTPGTGCAPSCTNNQGSYDCGCSAGFSLDVDGVSCIGMYISVYLSVNIIVVQLLGHSCHFADDDECASGSHSCTCTGLVGCTPSCTNTGGSYTCGCSAGFVISVDGLTCVG